MGEGGGVILSAPSWFSLNNSETVKDMKLGPVTKLDQRNTTTSKDFDDDVIWTNCDVTIFFPIYGQFASIRKGYFRDTGSKMTEK